MSKGHGVTQRAILAYLDAQPRQHDHFGWRDGMMRTTTYPWPRWTTIKSLAHSIAYPDENDGWTEPTRAQVESTRRAAMRLNDEGLAEVATISVRGTAHYRAPRGEPWYGEMVERDADRWQLAIRPVLTEEERAAEVADRTQRQRLAAAMVRAAGLG
jgi:hypothetical protein